jgi:hypothetical protein
MLLHCNMLVRRVLVKTLYLIEEGRVQNDFHPRKDKKKNFFWGGGASGVR